MEYFGVQGPRRMTREGRSAIADAQVGRRENGPSARFGRNLAVVVGIDTYGEGIPRLRSAVADATAIAEVLRRDHGFETWCLLEGDARLAHLLVLLRERLPAALGPGDRLLFYFAGHGIALDGDAGPAGYLVPAFARRADRDGFLPMQVVHGELARLPVRHALVILDCCFAGTFRWSSLRDVAPAAEKIYRERYDRYLESPAWQVLTSASGDQLALDMLADNRGEGAGTHSPFALALLEGLAGGADYTGDHLVTADELAMLARERVAPAAESIGRRQVPQLFPLERHDCGQFVFQVPGRPLALAAAPPLEDATNPYRGLQSFRADDRALFFGRDEVTGRLIAAVTAQQLTVVVGPSGSGKSSVVHAGLVPALADRGWQVLPAQRPGHRPLALLAGWAHALGAPPGDPIAAWLGAIHRRANTWPCLVIVDQLEELLTHRVDERERAAFLDALATALRIDPQLRLVVTVRSDAEPQLHDTALSPWWGAARFTVPAMTRDQLRQIIERPATAAVLHFEPSRLVDRLIDDVALVPAPLPLLSFALSELYRRCWARWQAGDRERALRETDYDELGSVARALTQRATLLHDALVAHDPAYAITIQNLFVRMVAVVGGGVARRRVPRHELVYTDPAENQRVDDVLRWFHDARLISLGTDDEVGAYVEPTHDELVRGWTIVDRWLGELDAPAGTRALLTALGTAVESWRASGRSDAYPWTDPRAELIAAIGQRRRLAFNADEAQFVERSVRLRRRRRMRVIGSLAGAIAVLAIAAGFARWQRGIAVANADLARTNAAEATRRLAGSYMESGRQQLLDGNYAQAVPYLVAARKAGLSSAPLEMLFAAARRHVPIAVLPHGGPVWSVVVSPDGTRIATASLDHAARIWSAAGELLATFPHREAVRHARFSPDGARLVTASSDGTARVWDVATGKPLSPPLEHGSNFSTFSPDGKRILTSVGEIGAYVWNAATGERLGSITLDDRLYAVAFAPDGRRVVVVSHGAAMLWDPATGERVALPVPAISFMYPIPMPLPYPEAGHHVISPDGARVLGVVGDAAHIIDVETGEPRKWAVPPGTAWAAFGPGGRMVTTRQERFPRMSTQLWDASGERVGGTLPHDLPILTATFSRDGTRLATLDIDGTVRIWDATTGEALSSPLHHPRRLSLATFDADGTRVITSTPDGVQIWDIGEPLSHPIAGDHRPRKADVSPDGTRYLAAVDGDDAHIRVHDAATRQAISAPIERKPGSYAAFSRDGLHLFIVGDNATARVWDAATGKPLGPPLAHRFHVSHADFSPDGTRVVTASGDHTARIWSVLTGQPLAPPLMHNDEVDRAVFSSDGARIVTVSGRTVQVWDATTGKPLGQPITTGASIVDAEFSPDGTRVVTAGDDTAQVWDAATGNPLSPPLEHRASVVRAAFSPDGLRVLTELRDGTSLAWDVPLDRGTLDDWIAVEQRSPYMLVDGALSLRLPSMTPDGQLPEWMN